MTILIDLKPPTESEWKSLYEIEKVVELLKEASERFAGVICWEFGLSLKWLNISQQLKDLRIDLDIDAHYRRKMLEYRDRGRAALECDSNSQLEIVYEIAKSRAFGTTPSLMDKREDPTIHNFPVSCMTSRELVKNVVIKEGDDDETDGI